MFHYANKGDLRSIAYEASKGSSLHIKDSFNRTLLHWAVDGGHAQVAKELVTAHNIDVNAEDLDGDTAYDYALVLEDAEMEQTLTSLGGKKGGHSHATDHTIKPATFQFATPYEPQQKQSHWQQQPVLLRSQQSEKGKEESEGKANEPAKITKATPQLPPNLKVREYTSFSDGDFQVLLNLVNETDEGEVNESIFPEFGFRPNLHDLKWKLCGREPGTRSICLGLYEQTEAQESLVGFVAATEISVEVDTSTLPFCYEIHTLVLHKKWRAQRLTVVLSNELIACLTKINNHKPIGVFTTANPLPAVVPLTCCKYYHRPIQTKKLITSGYWALSKGQTKVDMVKKYKYSTDVTGWRRVTSDDAEKVCKLLNDYLRKFSIRQVFSQAQFEFMLLSDSVRSYAKFDTSGVPTDFLSYYIIETGRSSRHSAIRAAFSFYTTVGTQPPSEVFKCLMHFAETCDKCDVLLVQDNFHHLKDFNGQESKLFTDLGFEEAFGAQLYFYMFNFIHEPVIPNEVAINTL